MKPNQYASVDDLQSQTTLQEAAAKCGVLINVHGSGTQVRLDCPFGCPGDHVSKRELSVDTSNPQKVFACHAYGCQVRGNLLTLMHGWLNGKLPPGGKLKGDDFKKVRDVLVGGRSNATLESVEATPTKAAEKKKVPPRNVPLAKSENEKARELVTLDEKFLRDVATMPPPATSYVRRHSSLTQESMAKWRCGVLTLDCGGDKRGWSLRGQIIYPVLSEDGQVLAWVARDPQFEAKNLAINALSPFERAKEKPPAKYRFPADFHRGQELFGQQASRLSEPGYRESVSKCGIIVVEGFNDVIGLDTLGVPAVAIMSNAITEAQVFKVERWARQIANSRVSILFDADEAGDNGAKEALVKFAEWGLDVRNGWSRAMHGGKFAGRQPETLNAEEWRTVILPALERVS